MLTGYRPYLVAARSKAVCISSRLANPLYRSSALCFGRGDRRCWTSTSLSNTSSSLCRVWSPDEHGREIRLVVRIVARTLLVLVLSCESPALHSCGTSEIRVDSRGPIAVDTDNDVISYMMLTAPCVKDLTSTCSWQLLAESPFGMENYRR